MVFLDKLPGLEVSILVNGAKVQEYDDDEEVEVKPGPVGEHQASVTVSKYVEAVDGAEFSIKLCLSPQFKMGAPSIQEKVFVDGNNAEGMVVGPDQVGRSHILEGPTTFHPSSGGGAGQWMIQKYKFSKLDISSEETRLSTLNKDKAEAEKVGTIEVRIWNVTAKKSVETCNKNDFKHKTASTKFHEKALKGQAKSHNVSYSAETPIGTQSLVTCTRIDGDDYPIAIYQFKYRSKVSLKQLLIIERTPEPEDSPAPVPAPNVDLGNLTPAQRERLEAFLRNEGIAAGRASHTPERKIKRERDNGEGSSNQARRKKSRTTQVIDLTADSDEDE